MTDELNTTKRLRDAIAAEAAAGWPFHNAETSARLGGEFSRTFINLIMRAIDRAGLQLQEKRPYPFTAGVKAWSDADE